MREPYNLPPPEFYIHDGRSCNDVYLGFWKLPVLGRGKGNVIFKPLPDSNNRIVTWDETLKGRGLDRPVQMCRD